MHNLNSYTVFRQIALSLGVKLRRDNASVHEAAPRLIRQVSTIDALATQGRDMPTAYHRAIGILRLVGIKRLQAMANDIARDHGVRATTAVA